MQPEETLTTVESTVPNRMPGITALKWDASNEVFRILTDSELVTADYSTASVITSPTTDLKRGLITDEKYLAEYNAEILRFEEAMTIFAEAANVGNEEYIDFRPLTVRDLIVSPEFSRDEEHPALFTTSAEALNFPVGFRIKLHIPSLTLSNGKTKIELYDCFFVLRVINFNKHLVTETRLQRATHSYSEYISGFSFSHASGKEGVQGRLANLCLGGGDLVSYLYRLRLCIEDYFTVSKEDKAQELRNKLRVFGIAFPELVCAYLSWESLSGGPYKKMADVLELRAAQVEAWKADREEAISYRGNVPASPNPLAALKIIIKLPFFADFAKLFSVVTEKTALKENVQVSVHCNSLTTLNDIINGTIIRHLIGGREMQDAEIAPPISIALPSGEQAYKLVFKSRAGSNGSLFEPTVLYKAPPLGVPRLINLVTALHSNWSRVDGDSRRYIPIAQGADIMFKDKRFPPTLYNDWFNGDRLIQDTPTEPVYTPIELILDDVTRAQSLAAAYASTLSGSGDPAQVFSSISSPLLGKPLINPHILTDNLLKIEIIPKRIIVYVKNLEDPWIKPYPEE